MDRYSHLFIPPGGDAPGSPAEHLRARRAALLKRLKQPLLVLGTDAEPGSEHLWWFNSTRALQEPQFLYLTGINQPGCHLILNPHGSEGAQELLFLPWKDPEKEFWNGVAFGLERRKEHCKDLIASELTGIQVHYPTEKLNQVLLELQKEWGEIALFAHDYALPPHLPPTFQEKWGEKIEVVNGEWRVREREAIDRARLKLEEKGIAFSPQPELLWSQRVVMDPPQLHALKEAQKRSLEAFLATLPTIPFAKSEREVERTLEAELLKRSVWGLSFASIVASGENGCTLHYSNNRAELQCDHLLLLDFGLKWGTLPSDISRTVPISGKFNPLQKMLYNIVLETQSFHQSNVKEGVTLHQLNEKAWAFLENLLEERFFSRGGVAQREYKKAPHGISHLIGEQVHEGDPFRLLNYSPLKAGMVISNEPGLYGTFSIQLDGVNYCQKIGIRIEDNLLVTKNGVVNLSAEFPHTAEEIESHFTSQ